jgi:hypothetical protein
MPEGLDAVTLRLLGAVRHYERNCRCPQCIGHGLPCVECSFCQANLQKLFRRELTGKPAAVFSDCQPSADRSMIALMKTKARKTVTAKKKSKASKTKPSLTLKKKSKKTAAKKTPTPVMKKKTMTGVDDPYAKRIFVRFETPELKEMVRKAAGATNVSLSAYIAAAAVNAAKEGWKLELKPQAVDTAA